MDTKRCAFFMLPPPRSSFTCIIHIQQIKGQLISRCSSVKFFNGRAAWRGRVLVLEGQCLLAAAKNSLALSTLFHSSALCYTYRYIFSSPSSSPSVCLLLFNVLHESVFSFECSARVQNIISLFFVYIVLLRVCRELRSDILKGNKGTNRK